jgi:hypothetical protein
MARCRKLPRRHGGRIAKRLDELRFGDGPVRCRRESADDAPRPPIARQRRKTYVAAIALQLVKEGKLGLDDKIEKYLGKETWFARLPNARDITVRMLMNHTSGLVRYELNEKFLADLTKNPAKVWQPEEEVAYLFDAKAPFAAGQGWDYSDTNYIVLGMIIERVTQSRYYDLLRKRLLRPLKLNDTVPSDSRRIPGLAQGYAGEKNVFGGSDAMLINGQFAINPQFEWTGAASLRPAPIWHVGRNCFMKAKPLIRLCCPKCSRRACAVGAGNEIWTGRDYPSDQAGRRVRTQWILPWLPD